MFILPRYNISFQFGNGAIKILKTSMTCSTHVQQSSKVHIYRFNCFWKQSYAERNSRTNNSFCFPKFTHCISPSS